MDFLQSLKEKPLGCFPRAQLEPAFHNVRPKHLLPPGSLPSLAGLQELRSLKLYAFGLFRIDLNSPEVCRERPMSAPLVCLCLHTHWNPTRELCVRNSWSQGLCSGRPRLGSWRERLVLDIVAPPPIKKCVSCCYFFSHVSFLKLDPPPLPGREKGPIL